jgi:hypothetical protein
MERERKRENQIIISKKIKFIGHSYIYNVFDIFFQVV